MNTLKWLVAGMALGVIAVAFRDFENERWLVPVGPWDAEDEGGEEDEEPVLGFDGMDVDTFLDWLGDAELDRDDLLRVQRYERTHLGREEVLDALADRLG